MKSVQILSLLALLPSLALTKLNYNEDISMKAVHYSAATYCTKNSVVDWGCGKPCEVNQGLTNITKIEHEEFDTFGFVGYNEKDNQIVVAFRGTNGFDIKNWVANMKMDQVPYKDVLNAKVHLGWY